MIPRYLFQRNSRSWKKLKKYLALVVEILRLVVTRCTESNSQPKPLFGDLNIKLMFQYTPFKLKHHALSIHLQSLMHTIKLPKLLLFGYFGFSFSKFKHLFVHCFWGWKVRWYLIDQSLDGLEKTCHIWVKLQTDTCLPSSEPSRTSTHCGSGIESWQHCPL